MIFVFVVMLIGLRTLFRTLNTFVRERFLARDRQILLLLAVSAVQFATTKYFSHSYFGIWIVSLLPLLISKISFELLIFIRERRFKDTFGHLLDEIIIEMRTGQSFRTSLMRANERSNPFVQQKMRKIIELVRFKTPIKDKKDSFIEFIVEEFRRIDENSHNSLHRILSLRHRIRTEHDYRRKSGQVVLQIRAQATILVLLYVATAIYVFTSMPINTIGGELLISAFLFIVGTSLVFLYGRSYKWKV